jgi:L-ascorbate metabolism protein UlaG (beta-lactamase superfamily)
MERLSRVIGPIATNVHVLADPRTREAIAIDTAIPSLDWIAEELTAREWKLKLIVSTHGHWDHTGDNAAVAAHTGADIAVHPLDRHRLEHPEPMWAPFDIPPSVPAVELAEGGEVRFGEIRLRVLPSVRRPPQAKYHLRPIRRDAHIARHALRDRVLNVDHSLRFGHGALLGCWVLAVSYWQLPVGSGSHHQPWDQTRIASRMISETRLPTTNGQSPRVSNRRDHPVTAKQDH